MPDFTWTSLERCEVLRSFTWPHGQHLECFCCWDCLGHSKRIWVWINTYKNTIFNGMNIHKSQLFWCSPGGTRFWHTARFHKPRNINKVIEIYWNTMAEFIKVHKKSSNRNAAAKQQDFVGWWPPFAAARDALSTEGCQNWCGHIGWSCIFWGQPQNLRRWIAPLTSLRRLGGRWTETGKVQLFNFQLIPSWGLSKKRALQNPVVYRNFPA